MTLLIYRHTASGRLVRAEPGSRLAALLAKDDGYEGTTESGGKPARRVAEKAPVKSEPAKPEGE